MGRWARTGNYSSIMQWNIITLLWCFVILRMLKWRLHRSVSYLSEVVGNKIEVYTFPNNVSDKWVKWVTGNCYAEGQIGICNLRYAVYWWPYSLYIACFWFAGPVLACTVRHGLYGGAGSMVVQVLHKRVSLINCQGTISTPHVPNYGSAEVDDAWFLEIRPADD